LALHGVVPYQNCAGAGCGGFMHQFLSPYLLAGAYLERRMLLIKHPKKRPGSSPDLSQYQYTTVLLPRTAIFKNIEKVLISKKLDFFRGGTSGTKGTRFLYKPYICPIILYLPYILALFYYFHFLLFHLFHLFHYIKIDIIFIDLY
jgi:hypothetical protein